MARNDGCRHDHESLAPIFRRLGKVCRLAARYMPWKPLGSRGASMIEFALVAPLLFTLIFGMLELGLVYVTNVSLGNATAQIARKVRVGQLVLPGNTVASGTGNQMTLSGFKTAVCNAIQLMVPATCMTQLQVDVRVQSSFGGSPPPTGSTNGNLNASGFCFYSGSPGNVVTMRAYMAWPIMTPGLLNMLSNTNSVTSGGQTTTGTFLLLTSSESFKNEPNPNTINTGNGC